MTAPNKLPKFINARELLEMGAHFMKKHPHPDRL